MVYSKSQNDIYLVEEKTFLLNSLFSRGIALNQSEIQPSIESAQGRCDNCIHFPCLGNISVANALCWPLHSDKYQPGSQIWEEGVGF